MIVGKSLDCGFWETNLETLGPPLISVGKLCKLYKPRFAYHQDTENKSAGEDCSLGVWDLTSPK